MSDSKEEMVNDIAKIEAEVKDALVGFQKKHEEVYIDGVDLHFLEDDAGNPHPANGIFAVRLDVRVR